MIPATGAGPPVPPDSDDRQQRLGDAIRAHVRPGMHLHFASTPSRSNAAIREVARAYLDQRPSFRVSSTGLHSMAHLLPLLGLADRLTACFFGDHYPAPRPSPLYSRLAAAGVALEHWPLWSMVASFRAGAQGDDWVVNRSLRGTSIAAELAARGEYREVEVPASEPGERRTLALCAAQRPDVTFLHAAAADAAGHVIMTGPRSEGLWSALAARRGVIVTVERIVSAEVTRAHADAIALPPHRVLAVCEEPFGAHPQPMACPPGLGILPYRDDFDHYEHWRELSNRADALAAFVAQVLRADDSGAAYRMYVGADRLAALEVRDVPAASVAIGAAVDSPAPPAVQSVITAAAPPPERAAVDQLIIAGARQLAARTRAIGARVLIAGIGHAFFAARIAQRQLAAAGVSLRVMVETGLYDVDCGPDGHGYLLAYENWVRARRLTAIDDILGVLACGADNHCIAALGAAQIDRRGNLNSTRLGGKLLVGSGGACDIAASAEEVVVLTRLAAGRLVHEVEYITSPGHAVLSVVTERGVLTRPDAGATSWTIASLAAAPDCDTVELALSALQGACPWRVTPGADLAFAPITHDEAQLLDALDPTGKYRHRAG